MPEIDLNQLFCPNPSGGLKPRCRGVAYFDLLGTRKQDALELHEKLAASVIELEREKCFLNKIETTYFSDTFLFYTDDDSKESVNGLDIAACGFFDGLIERDIPVRGAMAFGQFYANKPNGIYFGQSLVAALKCGEKYNWLGFVLDKSAQNEMTRLGRSATERTHYRNWKAQLGKRFCDKDEKEDVIAYFKSTNIQAFENMASCYEDRPDIKQKYLNAIEFHKAMSKLPS